jgi:sugar phosphate isomerase/epimerase
MELGFCSGIDFIRDVAEAGFDYIELPVKSLLIEKEEREFLNFKKYLSKFPLKPKVFNCFIPEKLKITGENINFGEIENYLNISIRRVKEVGGEIIVFGSGGARNVPENFPKDLAIQQIKKFLNLAADIAEKYEIVIVIEPLGPSHCNIINTTLEGNNIVKDLKRREIKLLADLRHIKDAGESFENLRIVKENLFHIHLCDYLSRENKYVYPGEGDWEIEKFVNILKDIKYNRYISLEHCKLEKGGNFLKWKKIKSDLLS